MGSRHCYGTPDSGFFLIDHRQTTTHEVEVGTGHLNSSKTIVLWTDNEENLQFFPMPVLSIREPRDANPDESSFYLGNYPGRACRTGRAGQGVDVFAKRAQKKS